MVENYLFVYGTLRRDSNSEMYQLLARYATWVGQATYQGRLYRVDYYPGVISSAHPEDVVQGEVYQLRRAEIILPLLDEYEECSSGFQKPTEYIRCLQSVTLKTSEKITAWIYLFNHATAALSQIESGDFYTP